MSDLKTFWDNPILTDAGLSGDSVVSSGSDPNIDTAGENAVNPLWSNPPVPTLTSGEESSNSVSGLPSLPNRFEPAAQPPGPPDLTDRRPGTIDEQ